MNGTSDGQYYRRFIDFLGKFVCKSFAVYTCKIATGYILK